MYIYIQTTGESLFPHSRHDLMVLLTITFNFRTGHLLLGLQKVCQSIPLPIPHSM